MQQYYICDECGFVAELSFKENQELIFCHNHIVPVAMRIVTRDDVASRSVISSQEAEKEQSGNFINSVLMLLTGVLYLIGLGISMAILLLVLKVLVTTWSWVF